MPAAASSSCNCSGDLHRRLVGHLHRHQHHFVRGQRHRPDDAVLVVAGFDQPGDDPVHADAVAAHDDRLELLVGVEELGVERLGVLRAQLEDVADLDRVPQGQLAAAPRAGIAVDRVAQVGEQIDLEIAVQVDARQVRVGLVRAGDAR